MTLRTEVHVNPDDVSQLIVARYVDYEAMRKVADVCKSLHNEGLHGSSEMRVAGHYPAGIIELYIARNGLTFREFMRDPYHHKQIMRDPTLAYFRVWDGAV